MSLVAATSSVLAALEKQGVSGCLVGGLAVSVRSDPRFTRDVDIVVAVRSDEQAEFVTRSLGALGYVVAATAEHESVGRLAMVRLADVNGVLVDLLFASSGVEPEIVAESEVIEVVPGVALPVARVGHLIAMKLLSVAPGRETDATDLRQMALTADDGEWERAGRAVRAIVERGYARGRDLVADLDALRRPIV